MEQHQESCHFHLHPDTGPSLSSSSDNQASAGSSYNASASSSSRANIHRTTLSPKRKRSENSQMTEPQLPTFVQTSNSELRVSKFAKDVCSTRQRTVSTVHPQLVVSRRLRRLEQSNMVRFLSCFPSPFLSSRRLFFSFPGFLFPRFSFLICPSQVP